jgi:hypothetical protein
MRKATRIVAASLGVVAGLAGLEHGYFEILQGNVQPSGLMIASMGLPCDPKIEWNACEPAMTIVPNFLLTGILSVIIGLLILIWSVAFIHRKHGGLVLMLLSIALLLFGGGIFPPLIGIIGGITATRINKPITRQPGQRSGPALRFLSRLWPWPLVILMVWLLGQFAVGHFFNDFLKSNGYLSLLLIIGFLPLSAFTAYARDVQTHERNSYAA